MFHETESASSALIAIDPATVLMQWISGIGLPDMADGLFASIPDRTFRLETTVDTVTDFCEHYFAWVTSRPVV